MTVPARRGACPTLRDPMPTGDGLLARLMPPDGRLSPVQLGGLATAAERHGNGILEVTARGSLQVRGLRPETVAPFATAVLALGLGAPDGPTVHVAPLAGLDPRAVADPRPLAARLRDAMPIAGLSPKLALAVDDGGRWPLDALRADIRLVARGAGRWLISLDRLPLGLVAEADAPAVVRKLLTAIAARGPAARGHDLIDQAPALQRAMKLKPGAVPAAAHSFEAIGRRETGTHAILGLGLAFGQTETAALLALAQCGAAEFRLAPGRVVLAIDPPEGFARTAADLGFITDAADPRRQIAACAGAPRCAAGLLATKDIAEKLARVLDPSSSVHVSGCAKGCAHPAAAPLTIVGTPAGAALVRDGTARDAPYDIVAPARIVDVVPRNMVPA